VRYKQTVMANIRTDRPGSMMLPGRSYQAYKTKCFSHQAYKTKCFSHQANKTKCFSYQAYKTKTKTKKNKTKSAVCTRPHGSRENRTEPNRTGPNEPNQTINKQAAQVTEN
jgi:hypothetical protein